MAWIVTAHLVTTSAYAGFQWTVRLVVYPQLARVPADSFASYERAHQSRISWLVAPLFAALAVTTALLFAADAALWATLSSAVLLLVVLALTGLVAVPLHRRLSRRWDPSAHRRLLRVDAVRVAAATLNVAVAVTLTPG